MWAHKEYQLFYLDWLGAQLGITTYSDWYKITVSHYRQNSGRQLLFYFKESPLHLVRKTVANRLIF